MLADKLRKSVLQSAIQGKLTEQLATDDKVEDLLQAIEEEKELYEFALNSENAKYFKDNPDLYSAYLNGVEDAAKYLSHHQLTKVR